MVDEFVRNKISKKQGAEITQEEIYEKYKQYCLSLNEQPESKIWFGRKMNVFGYSSKQISKYERVYFGIAVTD